MSERTDNAIYRVAFATENTNIKFLFLLRNISIYIFL